MVPRVVDIIGASRKLIKDDRALRKKIGKEGLRNELHERYEKSTSFHREERNGIKTNTPLYWELKGC